MRSTLLSMLKRGFRAIGLEVSFANSSLSEENVLRDVVKNNNFDLVIDVGANAGQYGTLIRMCGYAGPILSFEPLSKVRERLRECAGRSPPWELAPPFALGEAAGEANINIASNAVSSSLLDMGARHLAAAPASVIVGQEKVTIVSLDEISDRFVGNAKSVFLKIDTQGYELQVLRGARNTMRDRITALQVELSLTELYTGQPLMLETCEYLHRQGFELTHIIPGFKEPTTKRLLQLDGIFHRRAAHK